MGFSNQFTWSKSRGALFNECERKYYLHHYAFWNGWLKSASDEAQRLYKLRALSTVASWRGDLVHTALKSVCTQIRDTGAPPPFRTALQHLNERVKAQWTYSKERLYWAERKARNPNWFGLHEHEFKVDISDDTPDMILVDAASALANVYRSKLFTDEICQVSHPGGFIDIDERNFFYLDGVKIWAIPDLMYRRTAGTVRIVDWKTGKPRPEDDNMQLAAYAAYAHLEHETPLEQLTTTLAFTQGAELNLVEAQPSMDLIRDFVAFARESMRRMTTKLRGPADDIVTLRRVNAPQDRESFALTSDTYKCRRCNFKNECFPDETV